MKKHMIAVSILLAGLTSTQAVAEEGAFNIGLASKSLVIVTDDGFATNTFTWVGLALSAGYDFTNYISLNGALYTLVETADTNSEMSGFDVDIRFGPNGLGFIYYGSLGYFSDTWNGSTLGVSQGYSGGSLGLGIGYNWENVNLNWNMFTFRSASDYQGSSTSDYTVGSSSLGIAYRF